MSFTPKAILFLLICAAAAFFVKREDDRGALAPVNRTYVDWLIGNSQQQIQPPSVTLLRLDEGDKAIFRTWPPGPLPHALMMQRLKIYSPKVVAIEPVLAWEDATEGLLDTLHTAALEFEPRQLLLGAELEWNEGAEVPQPRTLSLLQPLPAVEGELEAIPEFTSVLALPDRRIAALGAPIGFTRIDLGDAPEKEDALLVPLLARIGDVVVPSFVLQAAMLELDATPADVRVELGKHIAIGDSLTIPIDPSGALNVFTGLRATLPIHDATVLIWDPAETEGGLGGQLGQEERDALQSRVVLLGLDDEKARTIPAGHGELISRAELFALAISTIQSGRYLERAPRSVEWIIWGGLIVVGLPLLRLRRGRAVGFALLLVLLYFAASMVMFKTTPRWVPPAVPVTLLGCILLAALTLAARREPSEEPESA